MTKWKYGVLCALPLLVLLAGFGLVTAFLQDHTERNCLRFVSTHVTTDVAAWKKLVCHG